ncbi:GrpB family protein [Phenylobacterium sp.]|jgi:GrpB-like predicted nucleotidyltransferase (UPF0157 family)|uniref:GrpB family protein n=1 Tax=Phenylobacterium sp. TaxID=1871053 RepID=UPI002F411115
MPKPDALSVVEVVPYDPRWPEQYRRERVAVLALGGDDLVELEHIGSTAIPGLAAKPIIDMMAAAPDMALAARAIGRLERAGYARVDTGARERLLLRKHETPRSIFHLHIVEMNTWDHRHERLMRDYLLTHPDTASAYGDLKASLAKLHAADRLAYTRAKTAFIQEVVDKATTALLRPRIDIWPE